MKTRKRKVISAALKAPLVLIVIISFIGGIIAAAKNLQGITITIPIIFGIVILMYFLGVWMQRKG